MRDSSPARGADLGDQRRRSALAYGRAATIASCARRSRAAATSFMARVIFCVDSDRRDPRPYGLERRAWRRLGGLRLPASSPIALNSVERRFSVLARSSQALPSFLDGLELASGPVRAATRTWPARARRRRVDRHVVDEAVVTANRMRTCFIDRQRLVLALLEELDHARAAGQLRCVALSRSEPNCANAASSRYCARSRRSLPATFFMAFDLRGAADAGHRDADVHGRAHAGVEQVGLEEDLPVGDRDDVGRDVRRHVAGLRLDDRQRGQRAARRACRDSLAARSSRREWR